MARPHYDELIKQAKHLISESDRSDLIRCLSPSYKVREQDRPAFIRDIQDDDSFATGHARYVKEKNAAVAYLMVDDALKKMDVSSLKKAFVLFKPETSELKDFNAAVNSIVLTGMRDKAFPKDALIQIDTHYPWIWDSHYSSTREVFSDLTEDLDTIMFIRNNMPNLKTEFWRKIDAHHFFFPNQADVIRHYDAFSQKLAYSIISSSLYDPLSNEAIIWRLQSHYPNLYKQALADVKKGIIKGDIKISKNMHDFLKMRLANPVSEKEWGTSSDYQDLLQTVISHGKTTSPLNRFFQKVHLR